MPHPPAALGKPTIVFVHGYPSSSWDWSAQAAHFAPKGYGLVVPDKPTAAKLYVGTALARNVINLFDAENPFKVSIVGNDWDTRVASRMVNLFPERVVAIGFLALGYMAPASSTDFTIVCEGARAATGRDLFGYMGYHSEEGAEKKYL